MRDQTFERSPDYSCVHDQTFVRSPDYSCVHDQIFVRSPDYSCVHDQTFVRSPDYSCVHDQTFVRSPDYSCVHDQTFVRSPDYSCVHDQTFVRFSLFPDHVNLNARQPRRAFIWVWTYRLSVWDLNLGTFLFKIFFCIDSKQGFLRMMFATKSVQSIHNAQYATKVCQARQIGSSKSSE